MKILTIEELKKLGFEINTNELNEITCKRSVKGFYYKCIHFCTLQIRINATVYINSI